MPQDILSPVFGALVFKRTAGLIPERRAYAPSGWWAKGLGPGQRAGEAPSGPSSQGSRGSVRVGGLQSYLKDQRNGPNDQKSVVLQIWWSWFCFLPHVSLASYKERNCDGIIVRLILTTLYHAQVLHCALGVLFYFISMAASQWGRSYPFYRRGKWDLGMLSNVSRTLNWW